MMGILTNDRLIDWCSCAQHPAGAVSISLRHRRAITRPRDAYVMDVQESRLWIAAETSASSAEIVDERAKWST